MSKRCRPSGPPEILARAEAHRRSMLALMDDPENPHFAHPMFWAPFVVVGEGGVLMRTQPV